jgi:hypothetical protein
MEIDSVRRRTRMNAVRAASTNGMDPQPYGTLSYTMYRCRGVTGRVYTGRLQYNTKIGSNNNNDDDNDTRYLLCAERIYVFIIRTNIVLLLRRCTYIRTYLCVHVVYSGDGKVSLVIYSPRGIAMIYVLYCTCARNDGVTRVVRSSIPLVHRKRNACTRVHSSPPGYVGGYAHKMTSALFSSYPRRYRS